MKFGYADTPEGQVHYVEQGQGEPIVLLHQTPRSVHMYTKLLPLLAQEYRAIAIDMLGYGQSARLPEDGDAMDVLARNTIGFLDALELSKAHLLGWHTGSVVAADVAADWPQRVSHANSFRLSADRERDRARAHARQHGRAATEMGVGQRWVASDVSLG